MSHHCKIEVSVRSNPQINVNVTQKHGVIGEVSKGGGGGTMDYERLKNKPLIEGVTLQGDKTLLELGVDLVTAQDVDNLF